MDVSLAAMPYNIGTYVRAAWEQPPARPIIQYGPNQWGQPQESDDHHPTLYPEARSKLPNSIMYDLARYINKGGMKEKDKEGNLQGV